MRLIKYLYHKLKDLFLSIAPFKLYTEEVPLYEVDESYREEVELLEIEKGQLLQLRAILSHTITLVHNIVINSASLDLLINDPSLALKYQANPEDESIKEKVNDYLQSTGSYNAQELGTDIVELIYKRFPAFKEASDKLNSMAEAEPNE